MSTLEAAQILKATSTGAVEGQYGTMMEIQRIYTIFQESLLIYIGGDYIWNRYGEIMKKTVTLYVDAEL